MVCAITIVVPTVRRNVDFPDMFEPVMITPCGGAEHDRVGHRVRHEDMTDVGERGGRRVGASRTGRVQPSVPARNEATLDGRVDLADRVDDAQQFRAPRAQFATAEVRGVRVEQQDRVHVLEHDRGQVGAARGLAAHPGRDAPQARQLRDVALRGVPTIGFEPRESRAR